MGGEEVGMGISYGTEPRPCQCVLWYRGQVGRAQIYYSL